MGGEKAITFANGRLGMEILLGGSQDGGGNNGGGFVREGSTATFMQDVIEASQEVPVVVDFWAPWCGPCKTLGPLLERLVNAERGGLRMVKINVDENQELAAQMRVQSIPAVYAFKDGRPVDAFVGAQSESQVRQFIQRLTGGQGTAAMLDEMLTQAAERLAAGDAEGAAQIYHQVLSQDQSNVPALAGYLRCLVKLGDTASAQQILDQLPPELADNSDIQGVKTALELAQRGGGADLGALERRVAADADDHQARYDLALAAFAAGDKQRAVDELLEIVRRDRAWNDEAARKELVKLFDALGPKDPLTAAGRRRLSSLLFA